MQLSLQSRPQYAGEGTCFIFPWNPSYSYTQGTSAMGLNVQMLCHFLLNTRLSSPCPTLLGSQMLGAKFIENSVTAQTVKLRPSMNKLQKSSAIPEQDQTPYQEVIIIRPEGLPEAWLSNHFN